MPQRSFFWPTRVQREIEVKTKTMCQEEAGTTWLALCLIRIWNFLIRVQGERPVGKWFVKHSEGEFGKSGMYRLSWSWDLRDIVSMAGVSVGNRTPESHPQSRRSAGERQYPRRRESFGPVKCRPLFIFLSPQRPLYIETWRVPSRWQCFSQWLTIDSLERRVLNLLVRNQDAGLKPGVKKILAGVYDSRMHTLRTPRVHGK